MIDDPAFKVLMANAEAMKRGALSLWTIYEKPLDHPDGFLARRFEILKGEILKGESAPTEDHLTGELEHIRLIFTRAGLYRLSRSPDDEPQVVETWV
jgi:hypothetical protein